MLIFHRKSAWQRLLAASGMTAALSSLPAAAQTPSPSVTAASEATYRVHHTLTVKDIPKGAKKVSIWFWIPQEDAAQQVLDFTVAQAPAGFRTRVDGSTGMTYLYSEVNRPDAATIPVVTDFTVCRRKTSVILDPEKAGPLTAQDRATFADDLRTDVPHMVVNASLRALADKICGSETNVVRQARLIYDYVVDNTQHYSKSPTAPKSSNEGDADYCLANGGGACTDMHSLFCALARARGIPTRFCFGSLLKAKNEGKDLDPGYRCWVLFFVPNYGWVPADMAAANLAPDLKDFYFGGLDARHLLFSRGRNLDLTPPQKGPPVNLFIRGYVEVDGKPYTNFDRDLTFVQQHDTPVVAAPAATSSTPPPAFSPIPGVTDQYGDFRGRFEALTDPKIIPAADLTELGDDEEVLGLTVGGQSRAYPARFNRLASHRQRHSRWPRRRHHLLQRLQQRCRL